MEKDYTREMLSKIRQLNEQTDKNKKFRNNNKEENKYKEKRRSRGKHT